MKLKVIYFVFLLCYVVSIFSIYYFIYNNEIKIGDNNMDNKINELDDLYKYKIKVYYPVTRYRMLDMKIKNIIFKYIDEFKNMVDIDDKRYNYYSLDINYDEYKYKEYMSYVFYIETYLGGAHPDHAIITVNYDISRNKIIDIDDLIDNDPNFLDNISHLSRIKLLSYEKFSSNDYVEDFFLEGTKPVRDNYINFVFTDSGIKILFDYYQIAPYYYGDSEIIIPYKDIGLDIEKIT